MAERIMYVCTICADDNPEMCGYCDRNDLRALPDGRWVCDGCFDDCRWDLRKRETEDLPTWFDFPPPPEYVSGHVAPTDEMVEWGAKAIISNWFDDRFSPETVEEAKRRIARAVLAVALKAAAVPPAPCDRSAEGDKTEGLGPKGESTVGEAEAH